MTRDEWNKIAESINAAWPAGALTEAQSDGYFDALKDLPADRVADAVLNAVRSGATSVPPAQRLRSPAPLPPAAGISQSFSKPTGRLVVDVPSQSTTPQPIYAQGPPLPPVEPVGRGAAWPRGQRATLTAIGIGGASALVAAGLVAGLILMFGPDEDAAYTRGEAAGHSAGYTEGQSAGQEDGYTSGHNAAIGDFEDSGAVDGGFYIVKYNNGSIESWTTSPLEVGVCYRITSDAGTYRYSPGFFC
jgi:hypothetical protein